MLRIIQNSSPAGAAGYYSTADYYSEGQELVGRWRGLGAEKLGLSGTVEKKDWDALCDNRDPGTGKPLTVRRKEERRVGFDFNFHVPKSVSVLYSLSKDERILDAFRDAVDQTMQDMEIEMKTRVRKEGKNEDRVTGNMVYGEFIHFTSRPVDGVPDPHLHAHCFVFNSTFDSQENRWKAGQFAGLKRDAPYFEAKFHSRLARNLAELGIATDRTKTGWEIAGIASTALEKFSRRTALIEEEAKSKGITDPREKSELGAKTRERKAKNLSMEELRELWASRLTADEQSSVSEAARQLGGKAIGEVADAAAQAVDYATEHCFERKSVVPERQLLAEALKRSAGKASVESVEREYQRRDLMTAERDDRRMVTTPAVLAEEKRMTGFAREGRGTCPKLGSASHVFRDERLNADQRRAVLHVLTSTDKIMLIRGAAGTGKTTMMTEAVAAIEDGGKEVFTFAPSADASRGVLRNEGFENAETVARLLLDEKLQARVKGNVIWIDEAGLLGTRTMADVFDLAEKLDARVILSGDRRQHGSVERGAALRLLETEAGLSSSEIRTIQRQKGAYKQAITALSEGRTEDGFRQLDELGWVREVSDEDRYKVLASEYIGAVKAGKSALVISPTHREADKITGEIRRELKQSKLIGTKGDVVTLNPIHLTQAERSDAVNYRQGDVLVYHQNAKGHRKGDRVVVGEGVLPLDQAERFQVYRPAKLALVEGDLVRMTRNGTTADGVHRLNNGAVYAVKSVSAEGDITLCNGWKIDRAFGHLTYGFVQTSFASQGRTVDRVFVGQSAESRGASSQEQWYVSTSRGREMVQIFTDDKAALLNAVSRSDDRLTATEFINERERRERAIGLQWMDSRRRDNEPAHDGQREKELVHER